MGRSPLIIRRALEAIAHAAYKDAAGRLLTTRLRYVGDLVVDLASEVADTQALAHALADVLHNFSEENSSYVLSAASAPNWIGLPSQVIGNLRMLNVADLANLVSDGIPVAWVPRASILDQLMTADTPMRRSLLLNYESEIMDDCIAVINGVKDGPMAKLAELLTEATIAARAGHRSAAQALAANVLDTALRKTYPGRRRWYSELKKIIVDLQRNRELSNLRTGLALAPVTLAMVDYDGQTGTIPDFYNRHATAHAVGPLQYTRINSIIAIMAATSALRECYELKWGQYRRSRRTCL